MPTSDPVEELAVRLTLDSSDAFDQLDAEIESLTEKTKAVGPPIDQLSQELYDAAFDVLTQVKLTGASLEDAVDETLRWNKTAGITKQELVAAYGSINAEISKLAAEAYPKAIAAMKRYGVTINNEQIPALKELINSIATTASQFEDSTAVIDEGVDALASGLARQQQEARDAGGATSYLGSQITGLATNLLGGLAVIKLFNKALQIMKDGIATAIEFAEANFRLAAAVRAQQRAQGEAAGTIDEWRGFAADLAAEFGRPTEQVFIEVAGTMQLMSRNLNLTAQDMQTLLHQGAALASLTGEQLQPTVEKLVNFIGSGYRQGLVDLGIEVNDVTLAQAAMAAGINKTFDEMTEAEKQTVRYQLVLQQTGFAAQDAAARSGTLVGQLDQANNKFNTASKIIGDLLLPLFVAFKTVAGELAITAAKLAYVIGAVLVGAMGNSLGVMVGAAKALQTFIEGLRHGRLAVNEAVEAFTDGFQALRDRIPQILSQLAGNMDNFGDETRSGMKKAGAAVKAGSAEMQEALSQASQAIDDANQRWAQGLADAEQRFKDRMADIQQDYEDRVIDIRTKLERGLEDIDRQANQKRMQAILKFQVAEIRAKQDHARKLAELEYQYSIDLEGAVRDRDAGRVLELQRRYKHERDQLNEEFDLREKRRKEDLQLELSEIERQRQIKRQERLIAYQEELADAALQAQRRRRDAEESRRRELRDLRGDIERRLGLQADGINKQLKLNAKGLQALYNQLNDAYGPNGWVEAFYQRYYAIIAGAKSTKTGGSKTTSTNLIPGSRDIGGYAAGGTAYATGPTQFMAGEGRPERIDVTPLSRAGGSNFAGGAAGGGGKAVIEVKVDTSERLMVEVADFVENDIADVVISANNGRQQARGAFR